MVRRIGSGLLALVAVVVWVALEPEEPPAPSTSSHARSITQALEEFDVNNQNAQGAPQQQVVNGWVARDLLSIVAAQQNDLIAAAAPETADQRVPALLALAVVGLALLGATTPVPAIADAPPAGGEPSTASQAEPPEAVSGEVPPEAGDVRDAHADADPGSAQGRPS